MSDGWHQRGLAASLGVEFATSLIKRGAGFCRRKPGVDALEALARAARLRIVGEDRVGAFHAAVGDQEALGALEVPGGGLDRLVEFFGVLGVGLRIRLD